MFEDNVYVSDFPFQESGEIYGMSVPKQSETTIHVLFNSYEPLKQQGFFMRNNWAITQELHEILAV